MKKLAVLVSAAAIVATPVLAADIVIGVPNWPSATATANILKVAIEDNLGLEVELQNGTNPIIFEAMDQRSMDAHPEVWLPNQQNLYDTYVEEKGTVAVNESGVPAFQGMCVPKYVADNNHITSIEDLTDPAKAAIFDTDGDGKGEIWIGVPGWAATPVEKVRAKSYGYDQTMELTEFDETLAYANLDNAIRANKPWVGVCYTPHYVFAQHELVRLKEPAYESSKWIIVQPTDDPDWLAKSSAPVAWPPISLHLAYRKALDTEKPEVANLFKHLKLTTDEVNAMSNALIIDKVEPETYAKKWVEEHQAEIIGWIAGQ